MARRSRPEIVVLDLMLPKMDGYSVCKALKRNADTELLPIVMLTARGETERTSPRIGNRSGRLRDEAVQST